MKTCPRCKAEKEDYFFQEPITMCLPCYGTAAGNQTLSPLELVMKAKKARKGRWNRLKPRAHSLSAAFQALAGKAEEDKKQKEKLEQLEEFEQPSINCEKCNSPTTHYDSTMTSEGVKLYCINCLRGPSNETKDEILP